MKKAIKFLLMITAVVIFIPLIFIEFLCWSFIGAPVMQLRGSRENYFDAYLESRVTVLHLFIFLLFTIESMFFNPLD